MGGELEAGSQLGDIYEDAQYAPCAHARAGNLPGGAEDPEVGQRRGNTATNFVSLGVFSIYKCYFLFQI